MAQLNSRFPRPSLFHAGAAPPIQYPGKPSSTAKTQKKLRAPGLVLLVELGVSALISGFSDRKHKFFCLSPPGLAR
jgi:hypothetical protein